MKAISFSQAQQNYDSMQQAEESSVDFYQEQNLEYMKGDAEWCQDAIDNSVSEVGLLLRQLFKAKKDDRPRLLAAMGWIIEIEAEKYLDKRALELALKDERP